MKKLKTILSLFIITILILGCGKEKEGEKKNAEKEVLKVGMELKWPPFETIDKNGKPIGISVDLAYELGKALGMKVKIVDTAFGSLVPALETNKIDIIIASMSATPERAKKINFSEPYFYFSLITLLNKETGIDTKEELFSREAVKFVGPKSFVSLAIPKEQANKPILREFDDKSSAVLEIVQGKADAFIIDAIAASEFNMKYPNQTEILWEPIEQSKICMGIKKGNDELLKKANKFISELKTNGVYDKLAEKYNKTISESLPGQSLDFFIEANE